LHVILDNVSSHKTPDIRSRLLQVQTRDDPGRQAAGPVPRQSAGSPANLFYFGQHAASQTYNVLATTTFEAGLTVSQPSYNEKSRPGGPAPLIPG
jgi:hypothetical protein